MKYTKSKKIPKALVEFLDKLTCTANSFNIINNNIGSEVIVSLYDDYKKLLIGNYEIFDNTIYYSGKEPTSMELEIKYSFDL